MLISKFDLYKPEWLELVFDDRNKAYGAYDLRKHYAANLVKSMAIAFFSVGLLYTTYSIFKPKPGEVLIETPVTIIPIVPNTTHPIIIPPKPHTVPHVQIATTKYPIFKPVIDKDAEEPPKITELQTTAIGTHTSKGKPEGETIDIVEGPGTPDAPKVSEDVPKELYEIQVFPQPIGGADAWAKYLQKNMHYPPLASEEGKQGRVIVSFIVEKDGHLSNITVERGAGYGMDEEAARVLRNAPAWKPGIQNGKPVRVKFTLPINFVIPDAD